MKENIRTKKRHGQTIKSAHAAHRSGFFALTLEQLQDALRCGVGGGQDAGAGLGEDLGAGEVGSFLGEIGVADGAFAGGYVFEGDAQAVHVGVEGISFKCAEAAAEDGDLADGALDDLTGGGCAAVGERGAAAGDDVAEEANVAVAELAGSGGLDSERYLLVAGDLRAKLELGAAAGDGEVA